MVINKKDKIRELRSELNMFGEDLRFKPRHEDHLAYMVVHHEYYACLHNFLGRLVFIK